MCEPTGASGTKKNVDLKHAGEELSPRQACHSNHRIDRPDAALFDRACSRCHAAGTPAAKLALRARDFLIAGEAELARITARIDALAANGHSADRLRKALKDANDTLLEVRPELHSFRPADLDASSARVAKALSAATEEAAALERRDSLTRLSLVLVTAFFLLMAGLFHQLVKAYDAEEDAGSSPDH